MIEHKSKISQLILERAIKKWGSMALVSQATGISEARLCRVLNKTQNTTRAPSFVIDNLLIVGKCLPKDEFLRIISKEYDKAQLTKKADEIILKKVVNSS